jgi:hypothetical protein
MTEVRLLLFGDFLLSDGFPRHTEGDNAWNPFADARLMSLVTAHDIIVGSLDCTMAGSTAAPETNGIVLKTGKAALATLKHLRMKVLSLATNHAFDFGLQGWAATRAVLLENEILPVGAGRTLEEAAAPVITEVNGVRLAWLAAADEATSAILAAPESAGVNPLAPVAALEERIRRLRQDNDLVAVLLHWGTEWYRLPTPGQRQIARQLVRAGADLIIGNHPHVIQASENLEGKPVFYALGNAVATEIEETGAEVLKPLPMNLQSLAVSIKVNGSRRISGLRNWHLCFRPVAGLAVLGEYRTSWYQKLLAWPQLTDRVYARLWNLYCLFMELFYIPIRYRLMAYGTGYCRQRLTARAMAQRLEQLRQRVYRRIA